MNEKPLAKTLVPVLAYPFQITGSKRPRRRNVASRHGRKRRFPGVKVLMMSFYVQELRACAEATGWRFDAFLYNALLDAKRNTERMFGMANGELTMLRKEDRARLACHYQAVCNAGRKAQLSDFYHPEAVAASGEPLAWAAWAVRDGWPTDSN